MDYRVYSDDQHVSVQYVNWPLRGVAQASNFGDLWYLNRVVVQPAERRGQGIGSRLLRTLQSELKTVGCEKLIVEPGGYGSDIDQLTRFYKKHGFVESGEGQLSWTP